MKKKIAMLFLVLTLCLPTYVYASEDVPRELDSTDTVTVSERDMILELQEKTDSDLRKAGLSPSEISRLRAINDKTVLEAARKQSDFELKQRGLTETQISIIRNEPNIQTAASQAYGEVTYTIKKVAYEYKSGNTVLTIKATWEWSSAPMCLFTDIIAMTTSDYNFTKTSSSGWANYRLSKNGEVKSKSALAMETGDSGRGISSKIDLSKTYNGAARPTKMIAFDGYITGTFRADKKKISAVGISSRYGHAEITLNPSVSFGEGASISFSPSTRIGTGKEAYQRVTL